MDWSVGEDLSVGEWIGVWHRIEVCVENQSVDEDWSLFQDC